MATIESFDTAHKVTARKDTARKPERHGAALSPSGLASRARMALLLKLGAAGVTYAFLLLLARLMDGAAFGTVAFFLNASLLLSVIGARGQQMAALQVLPPLHDRGNHAAIARFRAVARSKALVGAATMAIMAFLAGILAQAHGGLAGISPMQMALGFALVPLVGLADLQSHFARAGHRIALAIWPREIAWRLGAGAAIWLVFLLHGGAPVPASVAIVCLFAALLVATAVQARQLALPLLEQGRPASTGPIPKTWHSAAPAFWLTSVSNIFLANADVVVLALFAGAKAAGLYFAANRLAMLLSFFQTSYNMVLGPMLSQHWQGGNRAAVAPLIRRATVKMTLPTFGLCLPLFVFAPNVLALFGPGFTAAAPALRLLVLAGLINAASGPADIALNMCGKHRAAMRASALALAVSAALLAVGAMAGGATGVAAAALAGTALRKALFWRLARSRLGLRCDVLAGMARPGFPKAARP